MDHDGDFYASARWPTLPVGQAPTGELLYAGQAARRRRRRGLTGGAAAAIALVLGAGAIGVRALTGHPDSSGLVADGSAGEAGAGTKLVGIGHVAVAVPASWADNAASCNSPFKDTAFFPWPQDCIKARTWAVSSVAITAGEFTETGTRPDDLEPAGRLDGHQVVEDAPNCLQGFSTSGNGGSTHCTQTFGVPDLNAYFTASIVGDDAERRLSSIRDSLTVLPDDRVAVPFVAPGSSAADASAALEEVGLSAEVVEWTCPITADCVGDGVTGVDPASGSVVPAGSAVTVRVLVRPGTQSSGEMPGQRQR